jgi:ParB family chromosome partitioning protein
VPPVIFRKVGDKNLLIDGHCRTRAYHELIAEGVEIRYMDAMEFQGSDAERVALMLSSAQALPLKPIERGNGYLRLKRYGWSVQQIAERTGLSETAIYQSIQLVQMDSIIQQMVKSGEVSAKTALEAVQQYGDKAPKILARTIEREKAKGRKVTRKNLVIPSVPPKHLKTVFHNVERLVDTLDNETRVRLAELETKPTELVQEERILIDASVLIELIRALGESKEAQRKRIEQEQLVLPTAEDSLLAM